jgi:hypothetical protein
MIEENTWYNVRKQSLAVAARDAGFDLAIYNQYSEDVQAELRKRTVKSIMRQIAYAFAESTESELSELLRGVYVISLSSPLTLTYEKKNSEVIYIGLGNVISRVESHFKKSLFDFMQSLSGADFDFKFANPHRSHHTDYYKHVEFKMLEYFRASVGSLPLLNSNAGSDRDIPADDEWWATPLKGAGKKPRWALTALKGSGFQRLDSNRSETGE